MMETNGAKECVKQLQKLKFRNAFFAHDNDNKTTAVLNASTNVKFEESLDRNHAVKAIERRFDKHFEKELKTINSKNAALNEFATNVVKDKSITDENIKSFMRKQTKNEPKIQKKHITPLRKHLVSWFFSWSHISQAFPKESNYGSMQPITGLEIILIVIMN